MCMRLAGSCFPGQSGTYRNERFMVERGDKTGGLKSKYTARSLKGRVDDCESFVSKKKQLVLFS